MAQEKNLMQQNQPQSGLASEIIVQADHKFYDHIIYKSKNKELMRQCCNNLNKQLHFFDIGDYAGFAVTLSEHDALFKNRDITVIKENKKENKKAQGFKGPDLSGNELFQRLARATKIVNAIDLIYFHAQLHKTQNPEMQIFTDLFKSNNINFIHYIQNPEDILIKLKDSLQKFENKKHFMGELNYLKIKRLLEINWRDRALTDAVLDEMIKNIHANPSVSLKNPQEYIDSSSSSKNLFSVGKKFISSTSKFFSEMSLGASQENDFLDFTSNNTVYLTSREKYNDNGKMPKITLEGIQVANSYINELYYLHLANEPELKYFDSHAVTRFDHYLEGCNNNPESLLYTLSTALNPLTKKYPIFEDEKKNLALLKIFLLTQLNIKIDYSSQVKNMTSLADLAVKIGTISTFSEVEQLKNAGLVIDPVSSAGVYYEKLWMHNNFKSAGKITTFPTLSEVEQLKNTELAMVPLCENLEAGYFTLQWILNVMPELRASGKISSEFKLSNNLNRTYLNTEVNNAVKSIYKIQHPDFAQFNILTPEERTIRCQNLIKQFEQSPAGAHQFLSNVLSQMITVAKNLATNDEIHESIKILTDCKDKVVACTSPLAQSEKTGVGENTANFYNEKNRQLNTTADPQPNLNTEERRQFSQQ